MNRLALVLPLFLLAAPAVAEAGAYADAVATYRRGDYVAAETMLRTIVDADAKEPATLKARYFLARTLMKQRKFDEAATLLIHIHRISPSFYREWSCDYLLGLCREATGKG